MTTTDSKPDIKPATSSSRKSSEKASDRAPAPAARIEDSAPSSAPQSPRGPLYKERLGRVQMSVWTREDKTGAVRFSVKLSRSYKTKDGFQETSSLDQRDLADAARLLLQAQEMLPREAASESPKQRQMESQE